VVLRLCFYVHRRCTIAASPQRRHHRTTTSTNAVTIAATVNVAVIILIAVTVIVSTNSSSNYNLANNGLLNRSFIPHLAPQGGPATGGPHPYPVHLHCYSAK
jgi:hypothetical protein